MKKGLYFLLGVSFSLIGLSETVSAAPNNANLEVRLQGPTSVAISTPTVYTVSVKNLQSSNSTATNTQLSVELPLTNTSPTVHILGNVSGLNQNCQIVSNKISCALGNIRKGNTVTVSYTYTAPVSTKTLQMKAIANSSINDAAPLNNTAIFLPNLTYPNRPLISATMNNSHCTGQALTSYFECLLYPSSLASHISIFNTDGSISFSEPGYTGSWSQPSQYQLHFEYFDGTGDKVAEFNGYAINGSNCFDGITNFFPTGNYVSPYRVCIQ